MAKSTAAVLAPVDHIARSILRIRGRNVLLDSELAALYGVATKRFNEQVRRNRERFPADFMFRLSEAEVAAKHGGRRHPPRAFTEHGAIMAAMILNSRRAVQMSVYVVRAFVKSRELRDAKAPLEARVDGLEKCLTRKLESHEQAIVGILAALRDLRVPPRTARRRCSRSSV